MNDKNLLGVIRSEPGLTKRELRTRMYAATGISCRSRPLRRGLDLLTALGKIDLREGRAYPTQGAQG